MISMSDFLTTILKDILEEPIVSDKYKDCYNISRNSFYYYAKYNKPLSKTVADALRQVILDTICNEKGKESEAVSFLIGFLTDKEKLNVKNTPEIVKVAISKFTTSGKHRNMENNDEIQENLHINTYPLKVVIGIVIWDNKLLLVKRRDGEANLTWQFPAGILKKNKLPEIILEREIKAETNVICKVALSIGDRIHPDTKVICKYYLCEYLSGEAINADYEENEDVQWVSLNDYEKYITSDIFIKVKNVLEKIKSEVLK